MQENCLEGTDLQFEGLELLDLGIEVHLAAVELEQRNLHQDTLLKEMLLREKYGVGAGIVVENFDQN